jgi:tetratricopeptide (TPR) repeat protein
MSRLEQLEKMLAAEPNDLFLHYSVAMELAKAERFDESLAGFRRVLELDAGYIAAYAQMGKLLLQLGRREEAKQALAAGAERAGGKGERHAKDDIEKLLRAI